MADKFISANALIKDLLNKSFYPVFVRRAIEGAPAVDVVAIVHGKWELYDNDEDGYSHHKCSHCKEDAIFTYEYEDMYDENYDGEWCYVGNICVGIDEHLTKFCPHCGTKMDGEKNEN